MKRRQFIQTASAGSALGAFGLVSGCASIGGSNGPKVVVMAVQPLPNTFACGLTMAFK
jgi:hypothetical protein